MGLAALTLTLTPPTVCLAGIAVLISPTLQITADRTIAATVLIHRLGTFFTPALGTTAGVERADTVLNLAVIATGSVTRLAAVTLSRAEPAILPA